MQYLLVTGTQVAENLRMSAKDSPLVAARRQRLRAWIQDRFNGSRKEFLEDVASRGKTLDPTEVSNLQTGAKSFGEKKASQVEAAAGMPRDYLVRPLDVEESQLARLDADIIRHAIKLAKKSFKLALDEDLVIERDPETFAQALRTAIAQRERTEANGGSGSGDGQAGATGGPARAEEDGEKAGSSDRRARVRKQA